MLLSEISSDTLELILLKIDGRSVSKLRECGSALLTAKMLQIVKKIRTTTQPFMKFPHSLFCWPHIQSVLLLADDDLSYYPITLNGAYPLPLTPVPTLEKFELSFAQSFSVLTLVDGQPLLDSIFPLLKTIILTNSTELLTEDHIKAVPRNLEKLTLSTMYTSSARHSLPCSILEDLPPKLNKLSIYAGHIRPKEETNAYSSIKWPVALRFLRLRLTSLQFLFHIPQEVEYLNLDISPPRGRSSSTFSSFSTSLLPKSLVACYIDGFLYGSSDGFRLDSCPPNLKVLATQLQFSSIASEIALLPKSLVELRVPMGVLDEVDISELLPNLETVIVAGAYPKRYLENLPGKLKSFHHQQRTGCNLADLPSLPSGLEALSIKTSGEASELKKIPRGLISLSMNVSSSLSSDLVEILPPCLESLSLDLHHFKDLDAVSRIPKTITSIEFSIRKDHPTILSQDPLLFEIFPTLNLTSIMLSFEITGTAWCQWVKSMKRFQSLSMLFIYASIDIPESDDVDMAYLNHIPPQVLDLYVPIGKATLLPIHMQNLPKSLRTLHFTSTESQTPTATDECFMNLPQSLTSLNLPSKLSGLTDNIINVIPPHLLDITLPNPELVRIYFERPHWEGYSYNANKPKYY